MKKYIFLLILILAWTGQAWGAELTNSDFISGYYFGGDSTYMYGVAQATDTLVIKRAANGTVTNGKDVSTLSATYDQVTHIIPTSTDGLIFAVVKDDATSIYYLLKSVDGGANFGSNDPAYDDGNYVMEFGLDGAAHTANVRVLGPCSFAEQSATSFLLGEYNVNTERTNGAANDRVRLMKSTDSGTTWAEVITWNNDGSNNNVRHIHSVQKDSTGDIYITFGDTTAGILRWDGTTDISTLSNQNLSYYGTAAGNVTYAADGISSGIAFDAQRYRTGRMLTDGTYFYYGADTLADDAERGIWKIAKDLLTVATRVDSTVIAYDAHALFGAIKTSSAGYYIIMDYVESTATDFLARIYISTNGSSWAVAGTMGIRDGEAGAITIYEWNGKIYIPEAGFAGGFTGDAGGTLALAIDSSYLEEGTQRRLHPVYYITATGNDSNNGRSLSGAWLTVTKAMTADQICIGGLVKIGAGTFAEGGTAIVGDYDSFTASPGNTIIKGSGAGSTIITGTATSAVVGLNAEEANTDFKDMTVYTETANAYAFRIEAGSTAGFYDMTLGVNTLASNGIRNLGTIVVDKCSFSLNTVATTYGVRTETAGVSTIKRSKFNGSTTTLLTIGGATLTGYNNTFYGFNTGAWANATSPTVVPVLKNNIFYGDGSATALSDTGGLEEADAQIDYNVFYNCTAVANIANSGGTHSVTTDPLFTDAANGNFRLKSGSSARNAGTDVSLTTDYIGRTVPHEGTQDIGAYEYYGGNKGLSLLGVGRF